MEFLRFTSNFVKRRFPIKAWSLEEYITLIERENVRVVDAIPKVKLKGFRVNNLEVGIIGVYRYLAEFRGKNPIGRDVILTETLGERFGSEKGVGDLKDRDIANLRTFLTIYKRLQQIKSRIPQIETEITSSKGKFSQDDYESMIRVSERERIIPWIVK